MQKAQPHEGLCYIFMYNILCLLSQRVKELCKSYPYIID